MNRTCKNGHTYAPEDRIGPHSGGCPTCRRQREQACIARNRRASPKYRAQLKARGAVRRGKLLRLPCEVCGELKSEAHHDDYTKPLEVRWLCRVHHREHHVRMGDVLPLRKDR
jgi:hypothetical protein